MLRPRPEQQPLLAGFATLLALGVTLPLAGIGSLSFSVGGVFSSIAAVSVLLKIMRPLRLRIVMPEPTTVSIEHATFSDVTALYVWHRYLGVCDADGITITRLRARWTVTQLEHLAEALRVPLTVHRDRIPKAATGSQLVADLMADGAAIAGSDVIVRDFGRHGADVARLVRILADSVPPDSGVVSRVRLRDTSAAEVGRVAAALLDAGAQIQLERPRALR